MSFEITKLDISQIETSWFFQEVFTLSPYQNTISLLYNPLEDSESVYLNNLILFPNDYTILNNQLKLNINNNVSSSILIKYSTKDEINRFYTWSDELGNVIWIDSISHIPILF